MTGELPATASFREFADLVPCKPGYVTHLRKTDRLVLTDDRKRVKVRESLQRIEETRDPARIGVTQRHAAARAAQGTPAPVQAVPAPGEGMSPGAAPDPAAAPEKESSLFQHWRERDMRAKALAAERENAIAEGKLMDADAVRDAVKSHVATLRAGLEALPDFLAPELVGVKDEPKIRATIAAAIEARLAELSRQLGLIAKEAA